jgi:hypothetical protein
MRGPQLLACIKASALTSQPLAEEEVSARQIRPDSCSTEPLDRVHIQFLGSLIFHQERLPRGPSACRRSFATRR